MSETVKYINDDGVEITIKKETFDSLPEFYFETYSENGKIKYSRQYEKGELTNIVLILIVVVVILSIYKTRPNRFEIDFEQKLINTISSNRIIDPAFFMGLSEEDLKTAIRQEILKINRDWRFKKKFIDLPKMTLLMEKLEFENLQKLYQWFFYKG